MADLRMPAVNSIIISGNLTKDPTYRKTTNGTPVANFPIACSRKFKDSTGSWREDVCYVGVVAWYKLAESCYENLLKGNAVIIEGELQSKSWKLDNGYYKNLVEIKAKRIQFLNRKTHTVLEDENEYSGDGYRIFPDYKPDAHPLAARSRLPGGGDSEVLDDPPGTDDSSGFTNRHNDKNNLEL